MCLLLKLVFIILLNETCAYVTQDTQMIMLPVLDSTNANNIPLTLKVFGQLIQLNLHRTDQIVSHAFDVWKYNTLVTEKWSHSISDSYFYVHEDHVSFAIFNFCQEYGLVSDIVILNMFSKMYKKGHVFLKSDILEIKPLRDNLASLSLIDDFCVREQINLSFGKAHFIKRSRQYFQNSNFYLDSLKQKQRHIRSPQTKLTVELAVFFDEAAYHILMPFLDNNKDKLHNLILAYVNRIQSVYHHPSFGVPLDISLVRLDIMEKQPLDLPVFDGESSKLLRSFCEYAATHNPANDNDPSHWDIGLYITGIKIYEVQHRVKWYIGGRANLNGACVPSNSCVIVQFGGDNITMGFASSLLAAHEIAHVLGISHDVNHMISNEEIGNCEDYKYIMTTLQYHRGQITWSVCSRDTARNLWKTKTCLLDHTNQKNHKNALDHSRFHDLPGREWTAEAQCELFLRDKDANVVTLHDICEILQCETPKKHGYFFPGPAIDGTHCAIRKECRGGECVPVIKPPYRFKYCKKDKWSEWKVDDCQSRCLTKSKGVIIKRRFCKHKTYNTTNCEGPYYGIDLCDDSNICRNNRMTIKEYTKLKCTEFNEILKNYINFFLLREIEKESGWQAPHDVKKPWIACTIFCTRFNYTTSAFHFHSPRERMLDIGTDPYFPDGTWCHEKDGQDYYCRQHYCLPENYTFEEELLRDFRYKSRSKRK